MIKPLAYFRVDTSNRGDWAIQKSITEAIKKRINIPFAFFSLKNDELTAERIKNQINPDCSGLMIAGSGIYSNYPTSSGFYFRCKPELFKEVKVPIFLVGLGANKNLKGNILNTELKEETKKNIKLINDLAVVSTVRDQRTYDILKNIGIIKHELILDSGNFLNVKQQPKRKRIAIQIAQHAPILGRFDGNNILRTYNIETYAKISTYLINLGYEIIFISHDALEHSLIIDLQKIEPRIKGLNSDNLEKMLQEYSSCLFSISMKMHSAIMSFASGTPAIQIYYDKKSIEYMRMVNCEELGICVFDKYYLKLKEKVDYMLKYCDNYAYYIQLIKQTEKRKFDKLIDKICNIIEGN